MNNIIMDYLFKQKFIIFENNSNLYIHISKNLLKSNYSNIYEEPYSKFEYLYFNYGYFQLINNQTIIEFLNYTKKNIIKHYKNNGNSLLHIISILFVIFNNFYNNKKIINKIELIVTKIINKYVDSTDINFHEIIDILIDYRKYNHINNLRKLLLKTNFVKYINKKYLIKYYGYKKDTIMDIEINKLFVFNK